MVLLQQAQEFIHQGTGAYESALGQQTSSAKSGRAVLALQERYEQGSSHFLDNLAEVSLTYEAKVVLDLIPHIYDRPGRVARILDTEDEPKSVILNAPFMEGRNGGRPQPLPPGMPMGGPPGMPMGGPPGMPMGAPPGMPMGAPPGMPMGGPPGMAPPGMGMGAPSPPEILQYDLAKGRYGVVVSIGRSYKSRAQEGADEMGQLFQANPSLFPILGDLYLKFRDFPGHVEAAERVKKLLPPPLQEPDNQPDPQALQAQLAQQGQMLEQLTKALDEKTREVETDAVKEQAITQREQADLQTRLDIERMKNETQLAIAQMKIQADEAKAVFDATTKRVGTESQWQYDEEMKARDQSQERDMKVLDGAVKAATTPAPAGTSQTPASAAPPEPTEPGYGYGV
jgi:hypothetical protein